MGVSAAAALELFVLLLLGANAALFWAAVDGGGGRAKGLGGPDAPALRSAFAEGDGGGSTTAGEGPAELLPLIGVRVGGLPSFGVESALAVSECSLGIWRLSCGRFAWRLFVLDMPVTSGIEESD